MGGIYGTSLPVFAEQYSALTYFNMAPAIDDGYGPITVTSSIRGILRLYSAPPTAEGVKLRENEGNLVVGDTPFLWYEQRLVPGWFIADQPLISGGNVVASSTNVYRIMTANVFDTVDSLVVHELVMLTGTNGLVSSGITFNTGPGSFQ